MNGVSVTKRAIIFMYHRYSKYRIYLCEIQKTNKTNKKEKRNRKKSIFGPGQDEVIKKKLLVLP